MKKAALEINNKTQLTSGSGFIWTLTGCVGVYLIISLHFLLAVRTAHFLGDPTYLPPSVLRFTSIFFRVAEVSAFVEIVFLVIWLAFIGFTCWGMFKAALTLIKYSGFESKGYQDCFKSAFYALLPVLILSLLTLSVTPIQDNKYGTASMSEIAESLPFTIFLSAMDEGTIAIFGVTLLVVITLTTALLLTKILPDTTFMFLVGIFLGVLISVAVMMFLMPLGVQSFNLIKQQTGNSYFSHFALFAVYSAISVMFILPAKKKKTIGEKLPA
jgi:hypothetical protein